MRTDVYPEIKGSSGTRPAPVEAPIPEVLIPEVRQHARRRRLRNLAFVLIGAAIAAGVFIFLGSGSPAGSRAGRPSSPSASGATRTDGREVTLRQPAALAVGPTVSCTSPTASGSRFLCGYPVDASGWSLAPG